MNELDFVSKLHTSTKRDYVQRVVDFDKAECAQIAKKFDREYWDGSRQYGYGGYHYDGRWRTVAEQMAEHYELRPDMHILDVGCGKAYLLYEFTQVIPGIQVSGIDISSYAVANSKEEIKLSLKIGSSTKLPWQNDSFDFVYSLTTLHNLKIFDLIKSIGEIERAGKNEKKYIMVESYRDEREKANLLYWQLTCESFYSPEELQWLYQQNGYQGDYGFIYFE